MRSALRWGNLALVALILYVMGRWQFHHFRFSLFLLSLLALSILTTAVFLLTQGDEGRR